MLSRGFTTMKNLNRYETQPALYKHLFVGLLVAAVLLVAGCSGERDENDGEVINAIVLPTDVVLNLFCEDVGLAGEDCVLDDPENPFVGTPIPEFDPNAPADADSKFDIADRLPQGPSGAKARFYFWATAFARRQSGENQYFTALALHELFNANSTVDVDGNVVLDELIQEHALRAYRSLLDNFFGSVWVQICFECPLRPDGEFPRIAVPLNERVADHIFRTASTATDQFPGGFRRLVPGDPSLALDLFSSWGYSYQPCTDLPTCSNGVVTVGEF